MYRELYPRVEVDFLNEIRTGGRAHGRQLRDFFLDHVQDGFIDSYACERLIDELIEAKLIMVERMDRPDPTLSQRAFLGLQYRKHPGWVSGAKEHFWYVRGVALPFLPAV